MSNSFSTEFVPASDRLAAWQWKAQQLCGDCRIQIPKHSSFHGSIDIRSVAGLELMRFSSSPLSFVESPSVTAGSASYMAISQLEGVRSYGQNGVMSVLQPGDSTLIDTGQPWSSRCHDQGARLYLRLPRRLLQNRFESNILPIAQRISGNVGLGATLFRIATSLYHDADMLNPQEGAAALEAYIDILSACLRHSGTDDAQAFRHHAELVSQIEAFIETHLPEPELGPVGIASAVGISVRHLHRLFALKGQTVGDWIRMRRLDQCRSHFCDIRSQGRTITEIAFSWGFSDSAHFSRSFKKQFGICPRSFRSGLQNRKSLPEPAPGELGYLHHPRPN
jgi:AraC family transcriptional regulator, positive regulator of tynA and feaB